MKVVLVTGRVVAISNDSAEMDNAQIEGNINVANKLEIKSAPELQAICPPRNRNFR